VKLLASVPVVELQMLCLSVQQSKSAITDHAVTFSHVIDWDQSMVIDRESSKMDRWIKEAVHIRKKQDKSMNRDEGSSHL